MHVMMYCLFHFLFFVISFIYKLRIVGNLKYKTYDKKIKIQQKS